MIMFAYPSSLPLLVLLVAFLPVMPFALAMPPSNGMAINTYKNFSNALHATRSEVISFSLCDNLALYEECPER